MATYALTDGEQRHYEMLVEKQAENGGTLYVLDGFGELEKDNKGNLKPREVIILKGGKQFKRHLVDTEGVVWRALPAGEPKQGPQGGTPWRATHVEIWTGRWRKVTLPDGNPGYAKCTIAVSTDPRVNGHQGMTNIQWYQMRKGFKHPLAKPDNPSAGQIDAMGGEKAVLAGAIYAKTAELTEGMDEKAKEIIDKDVQESANAGQEQGGQSDPSQAKGDGATTGSAAEPVGSGVQPEGSRTNREKS